MKKKAIENEDKIIQREKTKIKWFKTNSKMRI